VTWDRTGDLQIFSLTLPQTELSRLIDFHFPVGVTVFIYIFICIRIVLKLHFCRDPGSDQGTSDLQSDALPTELSRLIDSHIPVGVTVLKLHFYRDLGSDWGPSDLQSDAPPN
jgi:hypothetical protein